MVRSKKMSIGIVRKHGRAQYLAGNHQRHGHQRADVELRRQRVVGGTNGVDVNCLLVVDGFLCDGALTGTQAPIAEMLGHPAVRFRTPELIGREKLPNVGAAYLKVGAGRGAEKLKEFARGECLCGGTRKIQQKFLKRVLLTTRQVCRDSLFRSSPQTSPFRQKWRLASLKS